jgi:hypothetical protein
MDPVSRAQSAENSAVAASKQPHLAQYQFKKGQSGNPSGRPRKALRVTKIYESILRKCKNRKEISESLMETLKSKGMAKVLLLREMAERTEGKIVQPVEGDLNVIHTLAEAVSGRRKALIDAE